MTHSLTATVRAPADTDLLVFVDTGHGTRLGILTDLDGTECRITGRQATCTISEDQAVGGPGVWQVVVVKSSPPAAVVEVTLTFVPH